MHQYIDRSTQTILDEKLFGDRIVRFLYANAREYAPTVFKALIGKRTSDVLGYLNFDLPLASHLLGNRRFLARCGVDLNECVADPASFKTPRDIFERQIRYWSCRPMTDDPTAIVSPCDARMTIGSLSENSLLYLKDKFFTYSELLGQQKTEWLDAFEEGDYAIFRLTPDKYHYNHTPINGKVVDHYILDGHYHSCNPAAIVAQASPFSKNKRVITIFQTDLPGGSGVGLVAMIEIVALMIGVVEQRYSGFEYESPEAITKGLFVGAGLPKSLYRPGSSTTLLLFQENRLDFQKDLLQNRIRTDVASRFSAGFGQPLVETDVQVRSTIGYRKN